MRRVFALTFVLTFGLCAENRQADAGEITINRTITRNIDRRVSRQGGQPFLNQFFGLANGLVNGFVNSQQPSDLIGELLKAVLKNVAGAGTNSQGANATVAQKVAVPDPNLTAADQKVRDMCAKLKITYVEIPLPTATGPVSSPAGLDPNFALPAPVPATFTPPSGQTPTP